MPESLGADVELLGAGAAVAASGALGAEICGVSTAGFGGADELVSSDGGGGVESLGFGLSELSELLELSDLLERLCRDDLPLESLAVATRLRPVEDFALVEFESSLDCALD